MSKKRSTVIWSSKQAPPKPRHAFELPDGNHSWPIPDNRVPNYSPEGVHGFVKIGDRIMLSAARLQDFEAIRAQENAIRTLADVVSRSLCKQYEDTYQAKRRWWAQVTSDLGMVDQPEAGRLQISADDWVTLLPDHKEDPCSQE